MALVIVAGGSAGTWWAYGKVKNRQSYRLVASGTEYLRDGKAEEAKMAFETALRLNPSNVSALRLLARLQQSQGLGDASLLTWQELAESGAMNLDDLTAYAMLAASRKDWALAQRLADAVARGGNPTLRHLLRSELFTSEGKPAEAEEELRLAAEVDQTGRSQYLLAQFLIRNRLNAETAAEVRDLLRGLSARPDELGAGALSSAISTGLVPPNELPGWIASLRAHPKKTPAMLLLADAAELSLDPNNQPRIVADLLARVQEDPVPERFAAMQWLASIGETDPAASLLSADEAVANAATLSLWLDLHTQLGKWDPTLAILSRSDLPIPGHLQKLYKGRALKMSGRTDEGDALFEEAYAEASAAEEIEPLAQAIAYLGLAGEDALLERGVREVLSRPDQSVEALRAILPALQRRRDARVVLSVCELAAASPHLADNLTLLNDRDYLRILLDVETDSEAVALRSSANPRDFALRVTAALDLMKSGNDAEALELLENCEPDVYVTALPPQHKAVVAAALALNNRGSEALAVASLIPPDLLTTHEADFLRARLADVIPAAGKKTN
jgi:tetratricopeptide (TPR) repeat protein